MWVKFFLSGCRSVMLTFPRLDLFPAPRSPTPKVWLLLPAALKLGTCAADGATLPALEALLGQLSLPLEGKGANGSSCRAASSFCRAAAAAAAALPAKKGAAGVCRGNDGGVGTICVGGNGASAPQPPSILVRVTGGTGAARSGSVAVVAARRGGVLLPAAALNSMPSALSAAASNLGGCGAKPYSVGGTTTHSGESRVASVTKAAWSASPLRTCPSEPPRFSAAARRKQAAVAAPPAAGAPFKRWARQRSSSNFCRTASREPKLTPCPDMALKMIAKRAI